MLQTELLLVTDAFQCRLAVAWHEVESSILAASFVATGLSKHTLCQQDQLVEKAYATAADNSRSTAYLQVQSLLLQLAKDPSQDVVDTAFEQLLPALLAWMADTDLLYTALLPAILTDIRASVER